MHEAAKLRVLRTPLASVRRIVANLAKRVLTQLPDLQAVCRRLLGLTGMEISTSSALLVASQPPAHWILLVVKIVMAMASTLRLAQRIAQ